LSKTEGEKEEFKRRKGGLYQTRKNGEGKEKRTPAEQRWKFPSYREGKAINDTGKL